MKTILLTRHSETEVPDSSLYTVFSQIEHILEKHYNLLKVENRSYGMRDSIIWTLENALDVDLIITNFSQHVETLRTNGWQGKAIFQALGGFPRGGAKFREIMPYLYHGDAIWFTSNADKGIYYEFIDTDKPHPEAVYLPFGVSPETFYPLKDRERREKHRETWGLKPDDFVLLYTGRITVEKNLQTTLGVVAELKRLGYPIKLVVVGRFEDVPFSELCIHTIDLEEKMRARIEALEITDDVIILEWQTREELNEVFNASDAFINLTLHHDENFGLSQIEAMSAGIPVIGTAWGGLKDTIENLKGGFSIDTWVSDNGIRIDTPAVIDAIQCLMENKKLAEEFRQQGRERVLTHFSADLYSQRLLQFVERVINTPLQKTTATYSDFGSRFQERFKRREQLYRFSKQKITASPIYNGLSDPDYKQLITPYTSKVVLKLKPNGLLFLALNGKQEASFFISEDFLYTIRIPICPEEAAIINQLSCWQVIPRQTLNHSDEILIGLIEKGIVGISTQTPAVL